MEFKVCFVAYGEYAHAHAYAANMKFAVYFGKRSAQLSSRLTEIVLIQPT